MYQFRALLVLLVVSVLTSCDTDFQLEGEWKDVPVVYAFLSIQDTAHYIRVQRAYLEPGGDAREIAQNPDSIYYQAGDVVVSMEVDNGSPIILERVNGEDEGYPRESGTFANSPNILYKVKSSVANLDEGDQIKLVIDRGGNTEPAIATTNILHEIQLANIPIDGFYRVGDYARNTRVEWRATGDFAEVFDVQMIIQYRESPNGDPNAYEDKQLVWVLDPAFIRNDDLSLQTVVFRNEAFYQFLAGALEPLGSGLRKFSRIDLQVTGAGGEIADYLRIAGANIGITSSQALPIYTNVEEGLGVVSSRYQAYYSGISIDQVARDSLYDGVYTKDLNFVP